MKLIVIPTKEEGNTLIKQVKKKILDKKFLTLYELKNNYLLAITRIGLVNSAIGLTWIINNYDIEIIFNLGSTANLNQELKSLDSVLAIKATYLDADNTCFGYLPGQIPQEVKYYELATQKIKKISTLQNKLNLKPVTIASSNSFITDKKVDYLKAFFSYPIDVVDMETTSFWNVADNFNIDFYCIRVISDSIIKKDNNIEFDKIITKISDKINDIFEVISSNFN